MLRRPVHVIAEAGTNHNGHVATGQALIEVARASGANSVKFQMIFAEGLYLPRFYRDGRYEESEVYTQRAATALTPDEYRRLADDAQQRGIAFSASVFDARGIALLDEFDAPYIKIASCDLNNWPLLRAAAETGRLLVVSTGMATLREIERSVQQVLRAGNVRVVLMHCVSVYPCPLERMNLEFLDVLRREFAFPIGLSDHTESSLAAAVALAKGATWIEKHFTLDRSANGFDHAYAMEPGPFAAFVRDVRATVAACEPRGQKVSEEEKNVRRRARRALYAARDIAAGEVLTEADVLAVRPEGPLPPSALGQVLGCHVRTALHAYEPLTWEVLEQREENDAALASAGGLQ